MCCRFYIRMFGFALMGLIINVQKTTTYVIFFYVLISNISTSYNSFQKRFMDIKKIIFHHYEKQESLTKNGEHYRKTIPKDLFSYICNEREILPFQREICVMLISTLIISCALFLALATIVFFGEEYDASPLVSAGAVLLSGKIPDLILKGLTKRETFKGWEKIHKEDTIRSGVDLWKNERAISAATANVPTALVWKTTSNEILV